MSWQGGSGHPGGGDGARRQRVASEDGEIGEEGEIVHSSPPRGPPSSALPGRDRPLDPSGGGRSLEGRPHDPLRPQSHDPHRRGVGGWGGPRSRGAPPQSHYRQRNPIHRSSSFQGRESSSNPPLARNQSFAGSRDRSNSFVGAATAANRPTDPRFRSAQPPPFVPGATSQPRGPRMERRFSSDGSQHDRPLPTKPTRRMPSYSSLADSSVTPTPTPTAATRDTSSTSTVPADLKGPPQTLSVNAPPTSTTTDFRRSDFRGSPTAPRRTNDYYGPSASTSTSTALGTGGPPLAPQLERRDFRSQRSPSVGERRVFSGHKPRHYRDPRFAKEDLPSIPNLPPKPLEPPGSPNATTQASSGASPPLRDHPPPPLRTASPPQRRMSNPPEPDEADPFGRSREWQPRPSPVHRKQHLQLSRGPPPAFLEEEGEPNGDPKAALESTKTTEWKKPSFGDSALSSPRKKPESPWKKPESWRKPPESTAWKKPEAPSSLHHKPPEAETPSDPRLQLDSPASPKKVEQMVPDKSPECKGSPQKTQPVRTEPSKKNPLLTSALGDADTVQRAETAVQLLSELIAKPDLKAAEGGMSQLPTKQLIMRGLAKLDIQIKKTQKEQNKARQELQERLAAEKMEEERKQKEEQERLESEQKKKDEATRLLKLREEKKEQFEEAKRNAHEMLETRVRQARGEEQKKQRDEMEKQIAKATETFEKDISKVRRELDKAVQSATKVEARVATAEADYRAKLKAEEEQVQRQPPPHAGDLVASILAENKRRATEAQMASLFLAVPQEPEAEESELIEELENRVDPKHGVSLAEWSARTKQVSGLADALYTEPSESPYFEVIEQTHAQIEPLVKEYVRDKKKRLVEHWTELAEEYEVRKQLYDKHVHRRASVKGKQNRSVSICNRQSIFSGDNASANIVSGGRSSNNPYRRARRGYEVRSEKDMEQVIAEIAAKEAMEKRITHGGSNIPRQIVPLEKKLCGTYTNTLKAQRVYDPLLQAEEAKISSVWSDMEKCIFLDRFLQHPKDFRKIASFLRNKTTRDCVKFYYDSKQSVPYKAALKEHIMRRKRRGDYPIWDATIQAALSVGAVITAGPSEEKPLIFTLPDSDSTFFTRSLHPLQRELFEPLLFNDSDIAAEEESDPEVLSPVSRKRKASPLFVLDPAEKKHLRVSAHDSAPAKSAATLRDSAPNTPVPEKKMTDPDFGRSPSRKPPQKWTAAEKKVFVETLEKHGRNWSMLSNAVGTKTISQIKNYYYDYKKQCGKYRSTSEKKPSKGDSKVRKMEEETEAEETEDMEADSSIIDRAQSAEPQDESMWAQQTERRSNEGDMEIRNQELSGSECLSPELWVQARHQALLKQHHQLQLQKQHLQQQQLSQQTHHVPHQAQGQQGSALEEGRRLMQHHSHAQHQQILSNLLPWVTAAQMAQAQAQAHAHAQAHAQAAAAFQQEGGSQNPSHSTVQEWVEAASQMQNLLSLGQAGHRPFSVGPSSHRHPVQLGGLASMNPTAFGVLDGAREQRTDPAESLARGILASIAGGGSGQESQAPSTSSAAEALRLLAALSRGDGSGFIPDGGVAGDKSHSEG